MKKLNFNYDNILKDKIPDDLIIIEFYNLFDKNIIINYFSFIFYETNIKNIDFAISFFLYNFLFDTKNQLLSIKNILEKLFKKLSVTYTYKNLTSSYNIQIKSFENIISGNILENNFISEIKLNINFTKYSHISEFLTNKKYKELLKNIILFYIKEQSIVKIHFFLSHTKPKFSCINFKNPCSLGLNSWIGSDKQRMSEDSYLGPVWVFLINSKTYALC